MGNFAGTSSRRMGGFLADSGESYKNKADCQSGIDLVKGEAPDARVEEK